MSDAQDENYRDVTPPEAPAAQGDVRGARQVSGQVAGQEIEQPSAPVPSDAGAPVTARQRTVPQKRAPAVPRTPKPRAGSFRAGRHVEPARFRARHWFVLFSFILLVLAPSVFGVWYLHNRAADQYHSVVGFSVRSEEVQNPLTALDAVMQSGPTTASDTDILYEYISSQQIVEEVMSELDLVTMFNKPENDPYFSLGVEPSVEDIVSYWESMVTISYDPGSAIIEVEARAFTAQDAFELADAVLRRSSTLVNNLSREAREDAIQFAEQDLLEARRDLTQRRRELRALRNRSQVVDPTSDVSQSDTVIVALEAQLAEALVQRRMLQGSVASGDSRLTAISRQIDAIRAQIEEERGKIGSGDFGQNDASRMIDIVGEFEELETELQFATEKYTLTQAAVAQAKTEARRQSRYLAAHIGPTKAQMAIYPDRLFLSLGLVGALSLGWLILIMIIFNVRDRR